MANQDTPFVHRQSPGEVVSLASARQARETNVEKAWERYAAAARRAQETLSVADGIAAGKAYGEFVRLFVRRAG